MTEYEAKVNPDVPPLHPGDVIEDILDGIGRSRSEIAELLGISRQHLHGLLAGRRPVSPDVAVRLGKLFGNGAAIWLRLQASYDAWHAEREVDVSGIPTIRAA